MKKIFTLLLLSIYIFLNSQSLIWHLEPNNNKSYGADVSATDNENNVYFSGSFQDAIGFKKDGTFQLTTASGFSLPYISKLDENGKFIWARKIDAENSRIKSISIDKFGNVIITGNCDGKSIDLNTDESATQIISAPAYSSLRGTFIIKLDSSGNFIWGNFYDQTWSVSYSVTDSENNIITLGQFSSNTDFDASSGKYFIPTSSLGVFVMKTTKDGTLKWVKYFSDFWTMGLKVDNNDNIICYGNFGSKLNFNGEKTWDLMDSYASKSFIIKLDKDGNYKWYQGLLDEFVAHHENNILATYGDGNIALISKFFKPININFPNKNLQASIQLSDGILRLNIDKNGNYLNHSIIQANRNSSFGNLLIDSKNNQRLYIPTEGKFFEIYDSKGFVEKTKMISENNTMYLKFSEEGKLLYNKSGIYSLYYFIFSLDKNDNLYIPGTISTAQKIDLNPNQDVTEFLEVDFFKSLGYLQKLSSCYFEVPDGDKVTNTCTSQNIKLSDLYPKTSYTTWYDSKTNPVALSPNTVVQNKTYYASVQDSSCGYNSTWLTVNANVANTLPKLSVTDFTLCYAEMYHLYDLSIDKTKGVLIFYDENGNLIPSSDNIIPNKQYSVAYTNGNCESEKATFKVYSESPIPLGNTVQNFCKFSNPKISDLVVSGQNLIFYNVYGNILDNNTILEDGKFYYVTQKINSCTSSKLEIKVNVTSPPLPTTTATQNFCKTKNPKISDIQITGQNIKWYDASGNLLTINQYLTNSTYYATQTISGCESDKVSIKITIDETPKPAANQNQEFCTTQLAKISDLKVTGTNLKFYDSLGNVLATSTLLQDNTSYFVTQNVGNCESKKFEIKVSINPNAVPANDYSEAFCNDTTNDFKNVNLTSYEPKLIAGTYIFEYFDQNNVAIPDKTSAKLNIGQNIFNVKFSTADGCYKWIKLTLQLNPKPKLNLPTNAEYCKGLFVTLDAGSGFKTYTWSFNGTELIQFKNQQTIDVNQAGSYTVKVTNASDCESTSVIEVKQSQVAEITKVEIVNNNATVIMSNSGNFLYSLDNKTWQISNQFNNLNNGSYTVYVKMTLGCIIGEMNFTIFNIPNAFTPNGDGNNDIWKITGMENYPNSEIKVYDRNEILVLNKITNGNFEWNGQFNGRNLPTGTYWYVIKISDGRLMNGYLLIKNRD